MAREWKPVDVDGIDTAFGGKMAVLLPPRDEIPEEFWRGRTPWNTVVSDWFFSGLRDAKWKPKKGIDQATALRHLMAILASWEPKHEHKEAGVAYLMSLWFRRVPTYTKAAS
jgi:hypothetical protein